MEKKEPCLPESTSFEPIDHETNLENSESNVLSDKNDEHIKTNIRSVSGDSAQLKENEEDPDGNSKDYLEINNDGQSESIGHQISRLSNLDLTLSEKKVAVSGTFNENNANADLNELAAYSSDQIQCQYPVNKLAENAQNNEEYKNENIYSKVEFTESVAKRFDNYKTTSNFQKLIEEEILKEKASLPVLPESVINPKKIEEKEEPEVSDLKDNVSSKSDLSQKNNAEKEIDTSKDLAEEKEGEDLGKSEQNNSKNHSSENENIDEDVQKQNDNDANEKQHPDLAIIGKESTINELNQDPNLTLLELANDLYSQKKTQVVVPEEEELNKIEDNEESIYEMIERVTANNSSQISKKEHINKPQSESPKKLPSEETEQLNQDHKEKPQTEEKQIEKSDSHQTEEETNQKEKSIFNQ
jgi:hypothetical protein